MGVSCFYKEKWTATLYCHIAFGILVLFKSALANCTVNGNTNNKV